MGAPDMTTEEHAAWWPRASELIARSAVAWYLIGAAATTLITLSLKFDDWYLFALMSLTTSIVVANYVRLHVRRSYIRRGMSLIFTISVVSAWGLLLCERTVDGWNIVGNQVLRLGAQPIFWLPVACCAMTLISLMTHYFVFVPKARAELERG
ncbi:MAG TPA: hypothetical protein DCQ06_08930 [Myxococcales bacterium]|nr:hypothetical protein [Myxococcales bacterium]HAN31705.1 hypothetical protein [Myxococcales bacterium]